MSWLFGKTEPEELLLYADTDVDDVAFTDGVAMVMGTDYADAPFALRFLGAKVLCFLENPERVEKGQIVKLKNRAKRLILFNDEDELFFEVEFKTCESLSVN